MNDEERLAKFRKWFRGAVEHSQEWQTAAKEDYEFTAGKQWSESEKKAFEKDGRPALTINRIKPLINVLSGYQRLNRYDIDFLARTNDDVELCQVRRGITKYVLDRCDYDAIESQTFLDTAIGGIGWFGVKCKFEEEINDYEAYVERVDPFGMYVDPEAHELDFSDAKYVCRAKWCDKDELKSVYPEKAEAIEAAYEYYDPIEKENTEPKEIDPLWWSAELQKVRVVECWYKEREKATMFYLKDGQTLKYNDESKQKIEEKIKNGEIAGYKEIGIKKVRCCVFFDRVMLEDMGSPYQHGEIPYVPCIYHYYGVGDIPAGFVRDLKDPQREINKRRIQEMHILNNTANGGGWYEQGAFATPEQQAEFRRNGNIPSHWQEVAVGALTQGRIRERGGQAPPTSVINAEQQATNDLTAISGINEQLLGVDIPSSASGRAIELRQKQAVTHLAVMFDALRRAKKKIAYLLWGRRGHAGLIPQYYTAEKTYRIEGENGQEFIQINQEVIQEDPIAGTIVKTINDISQGEFDVVISDVESSATQRQAQLWNMIDAVSKLGIPGDMIFPELIDYSEMPKKQEIKQRWYEREKQQQIQAEQQAQAQMEIERIKNQNQTINFKDAPLPIQFAMAAQYGIIAEEIAQYFMKTWIEQMAPKLALEAQQQALMGQQGQMEAQQMPAPIIQQQPVQQNREQLTEAAVNGIREELTPVV